MQLETAEETKDDTYSYYNAKTDRFSLFAITGQKSETIKGIESTEAPTGTAQDGTSSVTATLPPTAPEPTSLVYIIILIGVIAVVAYLYAAKRKNK